MEDIKIKISKETRAITYISNIKIGNDGENLQGNIVFSFDDEFVNGQARIETEIDGNKAYQILTKEDEVYKIPIKSTITKSGRHNFQLVITEGTDINEIPIFKSKMFVLKVDPSINALIEQPDEYPTWIEIANAKLNQIDEKIDEVNIAINESNTLDVDINKINKVVTIDLTKKDGTIKSVSVRDGYDLDYDWEGTSLGIKREDEEEYEYINLKGEKGDCNFATFEIIDGHLKMNKPDDLSQFNFSLSSNGHLEMEVSV